MTAALAAPAGPRAVLVRYAPLLLPVVLAAATLAVTSLLPTRFSTTAFVSLPHGTNSNVIASVLLQGGFRGELAKANGGLAFTQAQASAAADAAERRLGRPGAGQDVLMTEDSLALGVTVAASAGDRRGSAMLANEAARQLIAKRQAILAGLVLQARLRLRSATSQSRGTGGLRVRGLALQQAESLSAGSTSVRRFARPADAIRTPRTWRDVAAAFVLGALLVAAAAWARRTRRPA